MVRSQVWIPFGVDLQIIVLWLKSSHINASWNQFLSELCDLIGVILLGLLSLTCIFIELLYLSGLNIEQRTIGYGCCQKQEAKLKNHVCSEQGLILLDSGSSVIRPLLYLQATMAGWKLKFELFCLQVYFLSVYKYVQIMEHNNTWFKNSKTQKHVLSLSGNEIECFLSLCQAQ